MEIIRVTDDSRALREPLWLERAQRVHRQLRPSLPEDYIATMQGIFADGGEMSVAVDGDAVIGVAVFRSFRNTHHGRRFYVDDLVTDEAHRSAGVGSALIASLEGLALARGGACMDLDSGTHRTGAHRFYFREGFIIPAFVLRKDF